MSLSYTDKCFMAGATRMANRIVEKANSIGLRVTYDVPTMGDGNCFYRAVLEQMKNRADIKDYFKQSNKHFSNYHELRVSVVNFVRLNYTLNNEYIQGYKSLYEASIHLENRNMNWLQFLHNQEKDGVYATELFIKATAVFLGIDIRVTSERCTLSNPFNVWSRFWDHHDGANNSFNGNVCMLLGNIDNVHFQSLIYIYEKNSHVDFTVETKTYASVLKNGSTLSDSDDISNINKSHLKRNIVMPENAIHKKKEKILFNTIQSLFKSSTLRKVVNHACICL